MAEIYHPRTVSEIIPEFQSDLFVGHENAQFAVGQVGKNDKTVFPVEKLAYHQLRAGVYNEQTGMISQEYIAPDGGEYDSDDDRSVHMAVIENCGEKKRLVGSMRLILRGDDEQLPIEAFFPDEFLDNSAPPVSCEVSRYIARHEERESQDAISWALFQQGIATAVTNNFGPMYATIDPALARIMRFKRVPITELAPAARVDKYNSTSLPVVIDINLFAERLENRTPGVLSQMADSQGEFTYFGERAPHIQIVSLGETALTAAGEQNEND